MNIFKICEKELLEGVWLFSQKILLALINLEEGQLMQEPHTALKGIYSDSGKDEEVLGSRGNWKDIDFTFPDIF